MVTLGKTTIDKYQERQAEKRALARGAPSDPSHSRISQESLPNQAHKEVSEKTDTSPPSYHELVVSHAILPPGLDSVRESKQSWAVVNGEGKFQREELSDAESFFDVSDGARVPDARMEAGMSSFVEKWKARRAERKARWEEVSMEGQTRCEQREVDRVARRAEKKGMWHRGGGCC